MPRVVYHTVLKQYSNFDSSEPDAIILNAYLTVLNQVEHGRYALRPNENLIIDFLRSVQDINKLTVLLINLHFT